MIPGASSPAQQQRNVDAFRYPIPADLWAELKDEGLLREDAPVPSASGPGHEASDHPLIGAWRLREWVALDDDGTTTPSMGDAPNGLVVYSGDGTMVTVIGRADRPRLAIR